MSYYNNGASGTASSGSVVTIESGEVAATIAPGTVLAVTQDGLWSVSLLNGAVVAVMQSGTWAVNLAPGADVNALPAAATSGGASAHAVVSLATVNAANIKSSAANIYGFSFSNTSASAWAYVKLFNKATTPAPGTDTPAAVYPIPPGGTLSRDMPVGLSFSAGLGIAVTANPALNDATAITANQVVGTVEYA
jgi:hypothetical protein